MQLWSFWFTFQTNIYLLVLVVGRVDVALLGWFDHVTQMLNEGLVKVVYDLVLNRTKSKGGYKLVWIYVFDKILL